MKTFRQFLLEKDNRGGKRNISLTSPVTLKPANPSGPVSPKAAMPNPNPISGKPGVLYKVKRPPNTTLDISK